MGTVVGKDLSKQILAETCESLALGPVGKDVFPAESMAQAKALSWRSWRSECTGGEIGEVGRRVTWPVGQGRTGSVAPAYSHLLQQHILVVIQRRDLGTTVQIPIRRLLPHFVHRAH